VEPSALSTTAERAPSRVHWLDGVRGAAAMFVVLHHVWLATWPNFPHDDGPWPLGWLLYGHLAVAIFIVVSGFSLALAPLSTGTQLRGGTRRFIRRRAWRILPAYWVALVFSTVIAVGVLHSVAGAGGTAKSVLVHGLLLQDVIGSQAPNGTFWSIAVEWQIYFLFPVILLVARKRSVELAVALTAAVVVIAHFVAQIGPPFDKIDHVTPQFLALFALGILAVHVGRGGRAEQLRRPLGVAALAVFLVMVLFGALEGPEWMVARYFYVDLAFGLAAACLLCALCAGGARGISRVLGSRAGLKLGLFSYSIYLMHAPIIALLHKYVVVPLDLPALAQFFVLLAIGVPAVLIGCYGFHLLFEAPFLRYRDMRSLRAIPIFRLRLPSRRPAPVLPAPEVAAAAAAARNDG
jgi:peptidoglycan/LPS O-acetylase OafA/YrhL